MNSVATPSPNGAAYASPTPRTELVTANIKWSDFVQEGFGLRVERDSVVKNISRVEVSFEKTRHEHFVKDSFHPQVRDLQQVEMGFPDNNFSTFVACS